MILLVLVLPRDAELWVNLTAEGLLMRQCAYWAPAAGLPAIETQSKVVELPYSNVFSPASLREIMIKISKEEAL